ncbi:hypothetical protein B7494_g6861 [Chlorociboria aeruginascens]|nr:hypothetical protein B7494_g6861 [Chlorociboria aeruginascens]
MIDTGSHKQEFHIRDLSTRNVLFFPMRAQIIRDIKDVKLQPGLNQIVIDGLTPPSMSIPSKLKGMEPPQ